MARLWGAVLAAPAIIAGTLVLGMVLLITTSILFILLGAITFSHVLTFSGASNGIVEVLRAWELAPWQMVLLMMAVLVVLGCFLDQVSIMMMTIPFFVPVAQALGLDMIRFGVLFLICMQIGLLTPPFGLLLFVMKSAAPPDVRMREIYAAAAPYVGFSAAVLLLVFLFPPLATGLAAWLL